MGLRFRENFHILLKRLKLLRAQLLDGFRARGEPHGCLTKTPVSHLGEPGKLKEPSLRELQHLCDLVDGAGLGNESLTTLDVHDVCEIDVGPCRKILRGKPALAPPKLYELR